MKTQPDTTEHTPRPRRRGPMVVAATLASVAIGAITAPGAAAAEATPDCLRFPAHDHQLPYIITWGDFDLWILEAEGEVFRFENPGTGTQLWTGNGANMEFVSKCTLPAPPAPTEEAAPAEEAPPVEPAAPVEPAPPAESGPAEEAAPAAPLPAPEPQPEAKAKPAPRREAPPVDRAEPSVPAPEDAPALLPPPAGREPHLEEAAAEEPAPGPQPIEEAPDTPDEGPQAPVEPEDSGTHYGTSPWPRGPQPEILPSPEASEDAEVLGAQLARTGSASALPLTVAGAIAIAIGLALTRASRITAALARRS